MKSRSVLNLFCSICLLFMAGCATFKPALKYDAAAQAASDVLASIQSASAQSLATPARIEPVRGRPHLALDDALACELKLALQTRSTMPAGDLAAWVARSAALAAERDALILSGLLPAEQRQLAHASPSEVSPEAVFAVLLKNAAGARALLLERELAYLATLTTPHDRMHYIQTLLHDAHPSIRTRGRVTRHLISFPAAPFIYGWMGYHILTDNKGPEDHHFEQSLRFEPDASRDAAIAARLDNATPDELLRLYAPRLVQEVQPDASWDPVVDRPGRIQLAMQALGAPAVTIDTTRPTLYGYLSEALIGGKRLQQLVYVFWYPMHAPKQPRDPEAGPAEGLILRITLDANQTPLAYETVHACGCYHRITPEQRLIEAARTACGEPIVGAEATLARPIGFSIDATVPESAGRFDKRDPHPTLWVRAGGHILAKVTAGSTAELKAETPSEPWTLRAYDELEALPFGSRRASMFGADGLVRGADRPEARLLYPTGIYHAGTPRERGTQLTHFDQHNFDDPRLLEQLLRWPEQLAPRSASN